MEKLEQLKQDLLQATFKLEEKQDTRLINIKSYEIAYQQVIENNLGGCWWKHTSINIFMDLLETKNPYQTIYNILKDIKTRG